MPYKFERIDRAFARAMNEQRSTEGRYRICVGEFRQIVRAAKVDDGKVGRSEAREIVHRAYWGYSNFTPAAERACNVTRLES